MALGALAIVSLIATAAAGTAQAVQQKKASEAQQRELLRRRDEEELAAQQQELQRRQEVNRVLAAQIAGGAASNVAFEGSPTTIATSDIQSADLTQMGAQAALSGRQQALTAQARSARNLGNLQQATTILSTGAQLGRIGLG